MDWKRIRKATANAADAVSTASRTLSEAVTSAKKVAEKRPHEVRETVKFGASGLVTGVVLGGGVGIAMLGGAVGIPLAAVGAIAGAIVGNRIGVEKDKKNLAEQLGREKEG